MRVVIVLPPGSRFDALRPTSIETVVRSLAVHSRDRADLTVICDEGAERGDDLNTVTIPHVLAPGRRARMVAGHIARLKPDIVEMHQHMPTATALAKRLRGLPLIIYRHNLLPGADGSVKRLVHGLRAPLFHSHAFVSEVARAEFADSYPRMADRAVAVTNAIDTTLWAAPVSGRSPLIAFAGRAAPEKGLAPLCAALEVVLDAAPEWRAELALGDWSAHQTWSEAQLAPLALFGDRVTVRRNAPYEEVRGLFQRAAIVAVPSLWREPFGLVAIEAHAAGSAVISSGTGGLAEASGGQAMIIPPEADFSDRLAEGLLRLIERPAEREALAEAGQAFAIRTHDARDRAQQLDDLRRRVRDGVLKP